MEPPIDLRGFGAEAGYLGDRADWADLRIATGVGWLVRILSWRLPDADSGA